MLFVLLTLLNLNCGSLFISKKVIYRGAFVSVDKFKYKTTKLDSFIFSNFKLLDESDTLIRNNLPSFDFGKYKKFGDTISLEYDGFIYSYYDKGFYRKNCFKEGSLDACVIRYYHNPDSIFIYEKYYANELVYKCIRTGDTMKRVFHRIYTPIW